MSNTRGLASWRKIYPIPHNGFHCDVKPGKRRDGLAQRQQRQSLRCTPSRSLPNITACRPALFTAGKRKDFLPSLLRVRRSPLIRSAIESGCKRCLANASRYARVSSHDQKEVLLRQVEPLKASGCTEVNTVIDSSLNCNKPGLKPLLNCILKGYVHTLSVVYEDRLLRFVTTLIRLMCRKTRTEMRVFARGVSQNLRRRTDLGRCAADDGFSVPVYTENEAKRAKRNVFELWSGFLLGSTRRTRTCNRPTWPILTLLTQSVINELGNGAALPAYRTMVRRLDEAPIKKNREQLEALLRAFGKERQHFINMLFTRDHRAFCTGNHWRKFRDALLTRQLNSEQEKQSPFMVSPSDGYRLMSTILTSR